MNKRKRKRKKIIIISFVVLLASLVLYFFLFKKVISGEIFKEQIPNYPYVLETRDSDLMEQTFDTLKEVLSKDEIDYQKYAENLAQLFIIDFYSLNNKKSKYDIGGTECIYADGKESFVQKAQDTIYNYFDKKNDYPKVTNIEVTNSSKTNYTYKDKEYEAYDVSLKWEFNENFGYDEKATITLVKIEKMLYVGEYKVEE